MLKKLASLFALMLIWPAISFAALPAGPGLSGFWQPCNNNIPIEGQFFLSQVVNVVSQKPTLFWYGEQRAQYPDWATTFSGEIFGSTIEGNWADVPKGQWFRNNGWAVLEANSKDLTKACVLTVVKKKGADPTFSKVVKKYAPGCSGSCK
jgi:hypothetical protein